MQFSEIHDKDPANKELIDKATKYLEQASTDVRKISHNLMPGLLTKLGLIEALEEMFENLGESDKMEAFFELVGPKTRLPENTEIMIYRIIQEMVNNTLKHSGADSIDMTLVIQPDEMNISYSDNGKGFDVDAVLEKKTMGMQNIQSRVKFLDGMLKVDSNGHGAVYRICIPLKPGSCEPAE
jgi:signal transduction histidine kinase